MVLGTPVLEATAPVRCRCIVQHQGVDSRARRAEHSVVALARFAERGSPNRGQLHPIM